MDGNTPSKPRPTASLFNQDLLRAQLVFEEKIDDLQSKLNAMYASMADMEGNTAKVQACIAAMSEIDMDFQDYGQQTLSRLRRLRSMRELYADVDDDMQTGVQELDQIMAEVETTMAALRQDKLAMMAQLKALHGKASKHQEKKEHAEAEPEPKAL